MVLLVVFHILSFLPQQVNADSLSKGVTVSAFDMEGENALPLSAVEIEENQTALDVLINATTNLDRDLEYSVHEEYGAFISKIGEAAPPTDSYDYWWGFYVNGEYQSVGASSYKVKNGDNITFRIINGNSEEVNVRVSGVDKSGEVILDETVPVVTGSSAYDALKIAGKTAKINIEATIDSKYFAYVNNIGDVELGEYDYWSTYLNDGYMQQGLSGEIVEAGDHLELVVESWTPTPPAEGEEDGEVPDTGAEKPGEDENTIPDPVETPKQETISKQKLDTTIKSTMQYQLNKGNLSGFDFVAIKAAGGEIPKQFVEKLINRIVTEKGTFRNVTDYERIVLSLSAAGIDSTNVEGYNLIEKIYSNDRMTVQGNNGVIYALLAFDSGNYEIPSDAKWTREKLTDYLLKQQLEDGGWSLFGTNPSVDITGMALAALAPYKDQPSVNTAINKAADWISSVQDSNGGFSNNDNGGDASETTAQIIIGLSSVGIDPTEERFTKQQKSEVKIMSEESTSSEVNLIQHLLSFKQEDGGFAHLVGGESNDIASTQALLALVAYDYFNAKEKGTIYQFAKPTIEIDPSLPLTEEPDKSEDSDETVEKEVEVQPSENENKVEEQTSNEQKEQKEEQGHRLPNTATPLFNLLAVGGALMLIGAGGTIVTKRRQVNKI